MNQSELKSDLIAWLEQQWDKAVKDSETPDKELLEKYTFYDGLTTAYEFTIARLNSAEGTEAPTVRSGRFTDSGIPATRSSDPDYLVFEVGESVFRALLPADPTHAASRLIEAVRNREKILDGYRKTVAGLGRVEALEADDVYWDDLFSNGDPVETGAVIFQSQGAEDHPISLDLLIMSDGTWQPDGFDSDREGTAADVRGYLSQWTGDNR
ncbi:hypothetical protein [Bifidobacterium breve]|uniref:hypothetical protein n=1 Tax=Bifidobacterium breve TaxID=1685 RepID=UPI000CA104D4|nr:hypothetical protein [Bifidobacterium breve]AUD87087.1 hypothetical protein NRBB57_1081 [Bifidobacterium breve]